MSKASAHDSNFTTEVKRLINRVNDRTPAQDSILDRAIDFFDQSAEVSEQNSSFDKKCAELNGQIIKANKTKKKELQYVLEQLKKSNIEHQSSDTKAKQERHKYLLETCNHLLRLSEGESYEETLRKSAQLLGTIQLLSPAEGDNIAEINQRHRSLYIAVLSLRLLDELIQTKQINDPFITPYLEMINVDDFQQFQSIAPEAYLNYTEQVKVAVVMAALLQDIGLHHEDAVRILDKTKQPENKAEPIRVLTPEERKALLQVSYRETNRYIIDGLGLLTYIGNSKEEKEVFIAREKAKSLFVRRLLKEAINSKKGLGNLLKVPQIYTSIVLSTKSNYNYKVLPKVFHVLNTSAERGVCQQNVVDSLYKITGMFPQGYGITYIPKTVDGVDMDFYEYAIVTQFYPEQPLEPICRQATRNLTYISYGHDIKVTTKSNLYFPETTKRFSRVSKERLLEILKRLVSNFNERKEHDILPRCWLPSDYFSIKNHQKLWNRRTDSR